MARKTPAYRPAKNCWNLMWAPMRLRVLVTALELKVFDAFEGAPATAAQISKRVKASARGTVMLLDELAALKFLKKSRDSYKLQPEAELYLVSSSQVYMGGMLQHAFELAQSWENLTEVVRTGKPVFQVDKTEQGAEFFKKLVAGLYAASYASSNLLLAELEGKGPKGRKTLDVLDVAAGSAAWSLPFAEKLKAHVTVLDLPVVVDVARQFVSQHKMEAQYDYKEGDLRKLNFGTEKFDVIILGHIVHSEGAKWGEKLISKCGKALRKGGLLLIPDMVPNDQRTEPEFPLLFALNMLVNTSEGSTYTPSEYKAWIKSAGLKFDWVIPAEKIGTQVVVARKS